MTAGSPRTRVALSVGLAAAVAIGAALAMQWRERAAGRELFNGTRPLAAHLDGHGESLPPMAARCVNCHEGAQVIGGAVDKAKLTHDVPRRGGPPSRYDEASFCKLLRTGIDPAWVLLPRAMPRYRVDDGDCANLWAYVTSR